MNIEERDQLVMELLYNPEDRARLLREAHLTDEDLAAVEQLVETADLAWMADYEPPALADDPVAALLGLLPDPTCRLDPKSLTNARKAARLHVGELVRQLDQRGWHFTAGDVFRWETRTAEDVPPAVVQAIAAIVNAPIDKLITVGAPAQARKAFAIIVATERFDQLVERWASAFQLSKAIASAQLQNRSLATVHRGEEPDPEQLFSSLEALIQSVESRKRT